MLSRILLVPNQNALKFVLSVINKIFPLPFLISLNGDDFLTKERFSSDTYPLINGSLVYNMGLLKLCLSLLMYTFEFLKRGKVLDSIP